MAPCLGHRVTWTATLLIDSRDAKVDGIDQLGDPFEWERFSRQPAVS